MVSNKQVRRLFKLSKKHKILKEAAIKADMNRKTARKYLNSRMLPSESKSDHFWRTRKDPFLNNWTQAKEMLELNPGLEAKTIFEYLQREYPGQFPDGQLRTFQRKVKQWRGLEGPPKEIFFPQIHHPGDLCESDFTSMNDLAITIQGEKFGHLVYHLVLTYSNWEAGTICFSESFESLSEGLQNALWELGGVPQRHRTDCLSAAINNLNSRKDFTERYKALLGHYKLEGSKTQPNSPNENGDVEQSHFRLKKALDQKLMLRGRRDFTSREEYDQFLKILFEELNANRFEKLQEELGKLKKLPMQRMESMTVHVSRVSRFSTINILHNVYSVNSRLIGEMVKVKCYVEHLEVWFAQKCVEILPRLIGKKKHRINYRHIIDWLIRKPGAFNNYRYRDELFPTTHFRIAYDELKVNQPSKADKEYLQILYQAAKESEALVDDILKQLINSDEGISSARVIESLQKKETLGTQTDVKIASPDLTEFDELLNIEETA